VLGQSSLVTSNVRWSDAEVARWQGHRCREMSTSAEARVAVTHTGFTFCKDNVIRSKSYTTKAPSANQPFRPSACAQSASESDHPPPSNSCTEVGYLRGGGGGGGGGGGEGPGVQSATRRVSHRNGPGRRADVAKSLTRYPQQLRKSPHCRSRTTRRIARSSLPASLAAVQRQSLESPQPSQPCCQGPCQHQASHSAATSQ